MTDKNFSWDKSIKDYYDFLICKNETKIDILPLYLKSILRR